MTSTACSSRMRIVDISHSGKTERKKTTATIITAVTAMLRACIKSEKARVIRNKAAIDKMIFWLIDNVMAVLEDC